MKKMIMNRNIVSKNQKSKKCMKESLKAYGKSSKPVIKGKIGKVTRCVGFEDNNFQSDCGENKSAGNLGIEEYLEILNRYGVAGVKALSSATPRNSGKTADSWYYTIEIGESKSVLSFCNSNVNNGENIAVLIQYGHGTGWGGYVVGNDYINPALRPLVEQIAEEMWKEVTKV